MQTNSNDLIKKVDKKHAIKEKNNTKSMTTTKSTTKIPPKNNKKYFFYSFESNYNLK